MAELKRLKYYAKGVQVFLSHAENPRHETSKLICTAVSNRLALKIAVNMNLMESRSQKAHEIYMHGTKNTGRGTPESAGESK